MARPRAPKPRQRHYQSRQPIREPGDERGALTRPPGGSPGGGGIPPAPPDYGTLTGIPGMPADIGEQYLNLVASQGATHAVAWLRTTDWHRQTFPGLGAGVAAGIIGSEGDYLAYKNQVNGHYKQFYGRDATIEEVGSFLSQGLTSTTVGQVGQGSANAAASGAEWQYLGGAFGGGQFSSTELQALGEQQAGRSSALGGTIQARVEGAVAKVRRVFEGQLAQTPSLLGQEPGKKRPDIGA